MARKTNPIKKQSQKIINQHDVEFGTESAPNFVLPCHICGKRVIDVSGRPKHTIKVRHKCPHCKNIVVTQILAANVI